MAKRYHARWIASLVMLALIALLAACGQTSTTSASGAKAQASQTPTTRETPTPTDVPLPYSFPKKWLPGPDGADLPQYPALVGSFVFSQSSPRTGYLCVVSGEAVDDSPATPPFISVTSDGGQTWEQASDSTSRAKSSCQIRSDQSNPKDIFVAAGKLSTAAGPEIPLFRSQDGGVTWKTINQPTITGDTTYIEGLAVFQSRLIVMLGIDGEAAPTTSTLFTSDNGGQTWQVVNLTVNGKTMQIGGQMWFDGRALFIEAGTPLCSQACGALNASPDVQQGRHQLSQPLSSQPPQPNDYFKSTDGARTWSQLQTPASNLSNFSLARSSDGSATYVIAEAPSGTSSQSATNTMGYYSKDGGTSWTQLPTFAGVESGYLDANSFGASGCFILPDGSVMATSLHTTGADAGVDPGVFLIRPSDPTSTWQPLIRSVNAHTVQPVATSTGVRVWGLTTTPEQHGGFLEYFDLP